MSDNIKVVVKVRPLIEREIQGKQSYQWRVKNNTLYQIDQNGKDLGQSFTFDKVYDKDAKTSDVYNDIAKPIVQAATAGFNGTIFAYGQTSSGKTYTMTGTESSPGIIHLAVLNLFDIIKNTSDRDFLVRVSYIEIYNETIRDLLDVDKDNVRVHETLQGIKVDCTEKVTPSPEEVLEVMGQGEVNRHKGATNMNELSSRSHSIFQITIESREHVEGAGAEAEAGCVNVSVLNLVDLAGSERAGQTGATGLRFKEGTHINRSLSALALVIKQLSEDPNKYANYRDSKLTRILQNSLGGNAKTSIVCAVTPAAVEETISTLQFANRAKAIKNKPEVNAVAKVDATMIHRLTKQMTRLQAQLESKKNIEEDNIKLQKQIAGLRKFILTGFGKQAAAAPHTRRALPAPRRVTISTLHALDEPACVPRPAFCTPSLKYNPLSISTTSLAPLQPGALPTVLEEPRLVTPPPSSVACSGDVIELDSDDELPAAAAGTCSPFHQCYGATKTPPCVLRRNAQLAERNLKDIVEFTEREKIYTPSVVEYIEKVEQNATVIAKLQEEIDIIKKQDNEKHTEINQLKEKIYKTEKDMEALITDKTALEKLCDQYGTQVTDLEVSYEVLFKKAKLREEELLSLLEDQKGRKPEEIGKLLSRTFENFMDMSKDISLVNSDNDSIVSPNDEPERNIHSILSNTQKQLAVKNKNIIDLETDVFNYKQIIATLENRLKELEESLNYLKERHSDTESENSLLKSTIDTLNSTITSQKENLEAANGCIVSNNSLIEELQIKLTQKENLSKININDSVLENMIATEEKFIASNDNMKNIILCLKRALEIRNKDIDELERTLKDKNDITLDNKRLADQLTIKTEQIENLQSEAEDSKKKINENIVAINKLMHENNVYKLEEQELLEKLSKSEHKITELETLNQENKICIKKLEEDNEKLTLTAVDKDLKEQELTAINNDLLKQIETLTYRIKDLETEVNNNHDVICSLQKGEKDSEEGLFQAKTAVTKLQTILKTLTGNIELVPEVMDNFTNIFSILCVSLNALENVTNDIVRQKQELKLVLEEKINKRDLEITELRERITEMDKYVRENVSLTLKINQLDDDLAKTHFQLDSVVSERDNFEASLIEAKENIDIKDEELASLKVKCESSDQILQDKDNVITEIQTQLKDLQNDNLNVQQSCVLSLRDKENAISELAEKNEIIFILEQKVNEHKITDQILQAKDKLVTSLTTKIEELENLLKENNNEMMKQLKDKDQEKQIIMNISQKVLDVSNGLGIQNESGESCEIYELILNTLDKIAQHIITLTNDESGDYTDLKKQSSELTLSNLNLVAKLSDYEVKNSQLLNDLEKIQNEKKSINDDLLRSEDILKHLKAELTSKTTELAIMEDKVREWKGQFTELDSTMKQQMHQLQLENYNIKSQIVDFTGGPELSTVSFEETERVSAYKQVPDTTSHSDTLSPPSLLTICCNKIIDYIQPKDMDSRTTSIDSNVETPIDDIQGSRCMCSQLMLELQLARDENYRIMDLLDQMELANQNLLRDQEAVREELKLLVEPAQELQKKIVNHKTNLSILTATTFAENWSLKSQVKVLQHHHQRFHNVCQRDIPDFKKQLRELMLLLKGDPSYDISQNVSFKRYSLPDVLDSSTAVANYKNESTLDGDLLMMDTNVTLTTAADITSPLHERTCLDLTQFYNEVSCQTNDLNEIVDHNIQQLEFLRDDNQSMQETLGKLQIENCKLRELVQKFSETKRSFTDAQNSPIKSNVTQDTNNSTSYDNSAIFECAKCIVLSELQCTQGKLKDEIQSLVAEMVHLKAQKTDIEQKYILETDSTDMLAKKHSILEKEYENKLQEIAKLNTIISNKNMQLKTLQDENDSLSTQVMENITEADDLNKLTDSLKQKNHDLTEKCCHLEQLVEELNNKNVSMENCAQGLIKDDLIRKMDALKSHTKLNRSLSDSDTSSRYNKICTLQSELHAGREDCKELTEDVVTIKHHLDRSNLSMELDMSMGDSNVFAYPKNYEALSPQLNTCSMPDIPEERSDDVYMMDKIDCFNYYVEKTGVEKDEIDSHLKIIEVMKMLYENLISKHGNEVENLTNKLKDYDESKSEMELQLLYMNTKCSKITKSCEESNKTYESVANVLTQVRDNINSLKQVIESASGNKDTELIDLLKEKFFKVIDSELNLCSCSTFESLIDKIFNRHQLELNGLVEKCSKLQTHTECLTTELNCLNESLEKVKSQLWAKESEYNLLKAQKERIQDISNAVTLDIVKKEEELNKKITQVYKTLTDLNILNMENVDLTSPSHENISSLFNYLISTCSNTRSEKDSLAQDIGNFKRSLEEKHKELEEAKLNNEALQAVIVTKDKTLRTLESLHDDLKNAYESKNEENKTNVNLIEKLSQDINVLKTTIAGKDIENANLKSLNEMINKEKDVYAVELKTCGETIKQNNIDMNKMTSDILVLRESVKESKLVIDNLNVEAKSLLQQNTELREQLDHKLQECSRLATNIKIHETTAEVQSRMIMRLQKQKTDDDTTISTKNKQLEELNEKYVALRDSAAASAPPPQSGAAGGALQAQMCKLEESGKPESPPGAGAARRRRSQHDARRASLGDARECDNIPERPALQPVLESRARPAELLDSSRRSTPSRGRDSLSLSRTDQSDRESDSSGVPPAVLAARRRRQSAHDVRRSVTPQESSNKLVEELNDLNPDTSGGSESSARALGQQLAACQRELVELRARYRELDDECDTCAAYLREREQKCSELKRERAALLATVAELEEKLSHNPDLSRDTVKPTVAHAAVNTDEDWTNLHSVVVDRMSFDAEVEKNKKLSKTIEELRFKKLELQKALRKHGGNRELEACKAELATCKQELVQLRQSYAELDDECETCAQYLRDREEQCRRLREANAQLESKLQALQEAAPAPAPPAPARARRRSAHDERRAHCSADLPSHESEIDGSRLTFEDTETNDVDYLKSELRALRGRVAALQRAPLGAAGSAIVQNQQLTDVMRENQKLKIRNAKLISLCKKRGKESDRENRDPADEG